MRESSKLKFGLFKLFDSFFSLEDMIDLKESLKSLESRLYKELYNLQLMIQNSFTERYHQPQQNYRNDHQDYYYNSRDNNPHRGFNNDQRNYYQTQHQAPSQQSNYHHQNHVQQTFYQTSTVAQVTASQKYSSTSPTSITSTQESLPKETSFKPPEVINVMKNKLKSLETVKTRSTKKPEITTTTEATTTSKPKPISTDPPKNEYIYYWKLENFPKVFRHAKKNEVFSHVFNVKGLFLRIRANLNHHENENLILDIEHLANIENADKMEIEISDGIVFKEIAEENLFQYSFAIMDQTKPNHDLISQIYWNTDNDNFLVPNSVLFLTNYVKNESLLIKLIINF